MPSTGIVGGADGCAGVLTAGSDDDGMESGVGRPRGSLRGSTLQSGKGFGFRRVIPRARPARGLPSCALILTPRALRKVDWPCLYHPAGGSRPRHPPPPTGAVQPPPP